MYLALVVLCLMCAHWAAIARGRDCPRTRPPFALRNNLRQIALALQSYHQANGCFPPAYVADKNGKPMHSWRVLILPYLGFDDLYKAYDFTEPWDGPNNKKTESAAKRNLVHEKEEPCQRTCSSEERSFRWILLYCVPPGSSLARGGGGGHAGGRGHGGGEAVQVVAITPEAAECMQAPLVPLPHLMDRVAVNSLTQAVAFGMRGRDQAFTTARCRPVWQRRG